MALGELLVSRVMHICGSNDDIVIQSIDHYTQCQARSKTTMERGLGRPKLGRELVVDGE